MVGRGSTPNDWFGRIFAPCLSAALSLICAGIVVYFSSQRAAIEDLRQKIGENSTSIALLKQTMDLNKTRRDEQLGELLGRVDRLEQRRR